MRVLQAAPAEPQHVGYDKMTASQFFPCSSLGSAPDNGSTEPFRRGESTILARLAQPSIVKGMRNRERTMRVTNRRANWDVWANVPGVKAWEAVALSLDIEPKNLKLLDHGWMGVEHFPHNEGKEFEDRLEVLRRNISFFNLRSVVMGDPDQCEIFIEDFARWALSLSWLVPPQLAALALRPPRQANERAKRTPILSTSERNSLLRLIIGMAVGGYRYDPLATRSSVAPEIVKDLESAGVPLDADTVRKYLKEAADLLPRETIKKG